MNESGANRLMDPLLRIETKLDRIDEKLDRAIAILDAAISRPLPPGFPLKRTGSRDSIWP